MEMRRLTKKLIMMKVKIRLKTRNILELKMLKSIKKSIIKF